MFPNLLPNFLTMHPNIIPSNYFFFDFACYWKRCCSSKMFVELTFKINVTFILFISGYSIWHYYITDVL